MGRLHALTAAYALLSRDGWMPIPLPAILIEELKPFVAEERVNIALTGPRVMLEPRAALATEMAVHELAMNAIKYGALSVPEGNIEVGWTVEKTGDDEHLVPKWVERNGPVVAQPRVRGFGMTMIERVFAHDVEGQAKVDFLPEGIVAILRAPARRQDTQRAAVTVLPSRVLAGKRVLIVEDEMLVALLIEEFLTDLGCSVVGHAAVSRPR